MRILQVHNRYRQAGGEDQTMLMDRSMLEHAGHEVFSHEVTNPGDGVRTAAALMLAPYNPIQARALGGAIADSRPDVAHVHNTWFSLSPAVFHALDRRDVPIVMTLNNYRPLCVDAGLYRDGRICTDCVGRGPWRGAAHRCYHGSAIVSTVAAATLSAGRRLGSWERVDRFVAPSKWVRSVYVDAGFDGDRIDVAPWVTVDPGPRACAPSDSTELLYVGRFDSKKGVDALLATWTTAASRLPGVTLTLIGDGPLAGTVRSWAERAPAVAVEGWMPRARLRERLLSARALLVPSRWHEPFGQVVIEAFAAGLPVLSSERGGLPELVGALDSSFVLPIDDTRAWRDGLIRLADDELVDSRGAAARELFNASYSLEAGAGRLLSVYERAIMDRESPVAAG